MNAKELIDELKGQGITLLWDGRSLYWDAPFEYAPSDEIIKLAEKNRDEIVRRINGPVPEELFSGTNAVRLIGGDCLGAMKRYPDNLVDLIVTDPPYGYSFMGKDWDKKLPSVKIWKECLRVLKAGAYAYIMSAPRQDVLTRMIANLESAGFNTGFTSLYWTYASGFPKAHNISKAIDKKAGSEPKEAFIGAYGGYQPKPAVEVILVVQKPLSEKTYADQALVNGKGVTWLDDCRIPYQDEDICSAEGGVQWSPERKRNEVVSRSGSQAGRFPANLLVSDDVLDDGKSHAGGYFPEVRGDTEHFGLSRLESETIGRINDSGGYSRYFSLDAWVARNLPFLIVPKASMREKNFGLETIDSHCLGEKGNGLNRICEKCGAPQLKPCDCEPKSWVQPKRRNHHPTVKPIQLMSYLITIGSREGEIVLDPFCGSGTTCLAARLLKRPSIGIENDPEYFKIAAARMRALNLLSHTGQEQQKTSGTKNKKG